MLMKRPMEYPVRTNRDCNLEKDNLRWVVGDTNTAGFRKNTGGQSYGTCTIAKSRKKFDFQNLMSFPKKE
jgi:hypothetical protein